MTEGEPLTPEETERMFPFEREQGGWWEYGHGPDGADKVWRPVRKWEPRAPLMPTVIHVHHDTEAHARSFNEGYEAAVTQGLADDPTLADDWLQAKLQAAKVEALREAADLVSDQGGRYWAEGKQRAMWLRKLADNWEAGA